MRPVLTSSTTMTARRPLSILLPALLLSVAVDAHDLWIERDGAQHTLTYGHERSAHEGAKRLEYRPETVLRAQCFDDAGRERTAERGTGYPATLRGDCAASVFLLSSGYWSKTPYGTRNLPKTEAGVVLDSWRSVEAVKRIDRWSPALGRALTGELEIVPADNPLKLKSGDKLRLRVTFQGQPVGGATVAYFGKPRGVSAADGGLNIRLNRPGFQHIEASLEQPLGDGKADKTLHAATLQFETP
jgi:nickel transport protein